jgi:hypothetical protein
MWEELASLLELPILHSESFCTESLGGHVTPSTVHHQLRATVSSHHGPYGFQGNLWTGQYHIFVHRYLAKA